MNQVPRAVKHGAAKLGPIIDCDLHHYFPSAEVALSYLDPEWHKHHLTYGWRGHQPTAFATSPYPRSAGGGHRRDVNPPSGLAAGADPDHFIADHLDQWPIEYGILNLGTHVGDQLHQAYDVALARAANTYTDQCWLQRDDRFLASICMPYESPRKAADEIEHRAGKPQFVQALFRARTAQPVGREFYWDIYEAAQAHGITIGMHLGGLCAFPITSAGWPSYYIEDHTLNSTTFQAQIVSMVCEGVFERFPKLKFVCVEGGFAWAAPLMWRMDKQWKRLKSEMPHLKRLPSEVIREHVRFTSQPMEEPHQLHELEQAIEHLGEEMLMFATDYPHWDYDNPLRAFQAELSPSLKNRIFHENARALWNLSPCRMRA